ncbi:hypothetical protein [Polyangium sorediatum]|uniref:Lipoprotein n=1 Tax=Polyangium sorediatum TaxID=889274 RepID=A0ABT6P6E2_9BACT|nr:hypothetical protein [Polyangium sorediatum]MDI1436183.1 hypothetical protein [Polyangium sorediatum]
MSTSHLDSPRKILDLGAGASACAWLGGPGLVAFLTSRPARMAVTPVAATSGDAIDLPRITAQEVALLSKDVALVRDKEGTVWSVPLADPYRVREIVRDMRMLLARPSGEGALAISDEGKVLTLSLGRGEVGARPVEVPGRMRAGDVGDGVTYLLAEGEGGGQLRVYPGTAPERGPSARVTLPAEAAEFDQVRGGRVSCVVYKRGSAGLCVVMRDGERAEASLVTLDAPIADVAVTDTSVIVAFASGKLALYEAASLAAPSEGPKVPVSTTAAGGKGRPRVLLVTTTKGATSVWIGTTEGEVMRAAVVEVAAAPEPPAAEPAAAVVEGPSKEEIEALRKEVASLQGALSEKERETEVAKGEVEAGRREHEAARGALEAERREHESVRGALEAERREHESLRRVLEAERREHESVRGALEAERREHASLRRVLEAERREHESARGALEAERREHEAVKGALEAAKQELARALDELREERAKFEHSLGKRIDGVLPERVRGGLDFVVSLVENRRR